MNIELFCAAGGMAEGFRRAGIVFDAAFDLSEDACDSYEQNHGHRPIRMDVGDICRLPGSWPNVDLLVADPPCTPWSRAGKRLGQADPRDMLRATVDLVGWWQPEQWLIANVPGLDDATNWETVQKTIGSLSPEWCVDYTKLDAADFGVPQHRVRPFWFGHRPGTPCIRWPALAHAVALSIVCRRPLGAAHAARRGTS